jgi:hypothetical protein
MGGPFRGWVLRYGKMKWTTTVMIEDDENKKKSKRNRGNYEEVGGNQSFHVVVQKRAPSLKWWFSMTDHVFRDGGLRDLDAQL